MDKLKDKRVLVLIGVVVVIIIALVIFFIFIKDKGELDASKLNSSEVVKKQEEVTNLVRGYVDNISNIKEYARNNSKVEFSIKELRGIFNVNTSKFTKLKYGCSEDNTFIKYDNDYNSYIVVLDCKDFYLD